MKRLPKKIQKLIKQKRFKLNTIEKDKNGSLLRGLDITIRIQTVGTVNERWWDHTPISKNNHDTIYVNLVVEGNAVTTKGGYGAERIINPINQVAKVERDDSWRYNPVWGHEYHKSIREYIRYRIESDIINYLKLFGIYDINHYDRKTIEIKKLSWGRC